MEWEPRMRDDAMNTMIGSPLAARNATCMAPLPPDGEKTCGKHASEQRVVGGLVLALCGEHALEYGERILRLMAPFSGEVNLDAK